MVDNTTPRRGVLQTQSYLTTTFEPNEPVGRQAERDEMAAALRPVMHGKPAQHLLISGPAGVGKTTMVNHVLNELSEESRAKTAYINCWQYDTRPSLLTELLVQLGYPAPRKGKPVDELLSKLTELLDKNRGIVVALDEFDQLSEKNEIVYDLHLVNQKAENPLGILMVSNRAPGELELDPRSESRLSCKNLEFEPYGTKDIVAILKERAVHAFASGAVSDGILEEIASRTVGEGGDCRRALELLRRAGQHADHTGKSKVTVADVDEVLDS